MSFASLLDSSMAIYLQGYTSNAIGERIKTETVLATVPCRINRLSGKNQIYMDNIATYITVRIFCAYRTDFTEWDYVVVSGVKYKIANVAVLDSHSIPHHLELDCYVESRK